MGESRVDAVDWVGLGVMLHDMTCSLFYPDLGRKERRKEGEIPEVLLRKITLPYLR